MHSEELRIESADGLSLEAVLDAPGEPRAATVLCHPHPKMGGTMNAPLLGALRDALVHAGWAVLRFNFRGIANSEGEASTGSAEVADAAGAVATLRERFPDLSVAIAGWSFGAAVAVRYAASDPELAACVGIAPAVTGKPGVTDGLPAAERRLAMPLLLVCGSNDHLVPAGDCRAWAAGAGAKVIEIPAANHFFWAKYDTLARHVLQFFEDNV